MNSASGYMSVIRTLFHGWTVPVAEMDAAFQALSKIDGLAGPVTEVSLHLRAPVDRARRIVGLTATGVRNKMLFASTVDVDLTKHKLDERVQAMLHVMKSLNTKLTDAKPADALADGMDPVVETWP